MKTWLYILTTLLALTLLGGLATNNDKHNGIFEALEQGNANELSFYFNQSINLTILDQTGLYGKKQAEIILANFFSKNKISSFEIIQLKDQINFSSVICNFKSYSDKSFIIHLTYYNINNKKVITDLSINYNK
ncbi:MAG: DUF4783 domain-containing protein [Bacteroidales bacterium]|nr:DUF4783 domain-containing protein [Bacteroidales bacterium]